MSETTYQEAGIEKTPHFVTQVARGISRVFAGAATGVFEGLALADQHARGTNYSTLGSGPLQGLYLRTRSYYYDGEDAEGRIEKGITKVVGWPVGYLAMAAMYAVLAPMTALSRATHNTFAKREKK